MTTDPVARLDSCDTLPNPNRDAGAAGSGVSRDTRLAEARLARRSARLLARDPLREPFSDVRSLPRDAFSAAKTSPPCFSSSFTSPFCVRPVWKSTSELGYPSAWTFVNLHAIEPTRSRDNVASTAWKLHAIEQTQLRSQYRVDGVGRLKFDFHAASDSPRTSDACSRSFQPPIRVGQAEPRQSTSVLGRDDGLLQVPRPCCSTCVEIKILRSVRVESSPRPPRHRRDACSMAWRGRFLTARPSRDGRAIAEK